MTAVQANAPSAIIRGPSVVLLCFCLQMGRAEGQPPVITEQPQMLPAAAGQRVTALVSASGSGPISYQWRRDGTPISNSLRTSGAMTFMLEIEPVRAEDAGTYDVVATNSAGSIASAPVELVVQSCGLDWSPEFCLQGINNYIGGPIKLHTVRTGPLRGLYAAGSFFEVGGQPARGLARWVDRRWTTPGGWLADRMGIAALHEYDAGNGTQLVAGGELRLERWRRYQSRGLVGWRSLAAARRRVCKRCRKVFRAVRCGRRPALVRRGRDGQQRRDNGQPHRAMERLAMVAAWGWRQR